MNKKFIVTAFCVLLILSVSAFVKTASAQTGGECSANKTISDRNTDYVLAPSVNIVINEIYGGSETGGIYNADFIELYNSSSTAVNISDYSVQYYTAGQVNLGAPTSTAHIPDATILQPFSYYVIRVSPDNRAGAPLPCVSLDDSASFAETGIDTAGGKLVLSSTGADLSDCNSTSNLVLDRVAWGVTPTVCSETANAAQSSGFSSVQMTNAFGNFTISGVESGATYIVNVSAKRYTFVPQVVSVTDSISGLNFTSQ